jgi:Rod binding domain-containing protein
MKGYMSPDTTMTMLQAQGGLDISRTANALKNAQNERNSDKAEATAKEFEAIFVSEMMKPMFEGIKTDGAFGGGKGEEIFRGFMLQEYGKMVAESGVLGIADAVKAKMIEMQAQADGKHKHMDAIASELNAIEPGGANAPNKDMTASKTQNTDGIIQ